MNTMGANTNTPIVMSILGFYTFIIVMFGLMGNSLAVAGSVSLPTSLGLITFPAEVLIFFFSAIGFTITTLPLWADTLLFAPGAIGLFYIGASFLRGSS